MSYATLLHGELSEVLELLDRGDADLSEIGLALMNVIRRVRRLEEAMAAVEIEACITKEAT